MTDVSRETHDRLQCFVSLLLRWNTTINLVGRGDETTIWHRHIDDSLQLGNLIRAQPERAIDLGSGAGFPGLVLAIANNIQFDLIEADQRKAAFLRAAAHATDAPVQIHACRIEDYQGAPAPLVTARGLAPLAKLLALALPLVATGGSCLFLKGESVEHELTEARAGWQMQCRRFPSKTARNASIVQITDLEPIA